MRHTGEMGHPNKVSEIVLLTDLKLESSGIIQKHNKRKNTSRAQNAFGFNKTKYTYLYHFTLSTHFI